MKNDELRKLVERLRRVDSGETLESIYADQRYPNATNFSLAYECDTKEASVYFLSLLDENQRLREALEIIGCHHNAAFNVAACESGTPTIRQIARQALNPTEPTCP